MKNREVIPLKQSLDFKLTLPGSKSITNRALLCAALAKGKSRLYGALKSDDTIVMMKVLQKLEIRNSKFEGGIEIEGCGGKFKKGNFEFDLHNAGTATRFLTAIMAVREGETIITGDKRMQERPIGDLIGGLQQIGVKITYLKNNGYPPIRISDFRFLISESKEFLIKMKGDKSSQYFSALLMLGPLLGRPLKIDVIGDLVSKPYIDITIKVLKAFGINVKNNSYKSFIVKPQVYKACDYQIEGDASAASYWTSIAYLHGGKVKFENLTKGSIQGDIRYERVLNEVSVASSANRGMSKKGGNTTCHLYGSRIKSGMTKGESEIAADMQAMPDVAMTLACTASFFKGKTKITGLSTLRIKETDRLDALERELNKIGVHTTTTKNSITIFSMGDPMGDRLLRPSAALRTRRGDPMGVGPVSPDRIANGSPIGSPIGTYNDHRMAMCFAVIGTKIPGIVIENPGCTDKTYPNFWEDLERMYLSKKIKLGQKNLILTGMRASGKSYLGKRIAKMLGRKFVDLDLEVERYAKMEISHIIKKHNWELFRKIEQKICSLYSESKGLIIATGGGVVLDPKNMKNLMNNGVNVCIFADPTVLIERMKKQSNRPALKGKDPLAELRGIWQERRDLYLKYADYVWDNTSGNVIKEGVKDIFL